VEPSGRALNVTHGIARARYRNSFETPELMQPGEVYEVEVTLFPTSIYLPAGHQIRIEVSASNFPLFSRNLNTAASPDVTSDHQVAHIQIHHTGEHRSRIVLPIIGRRAASDDAAEDGSTRDDSRDDSR